jgi:hypothetical protein
MISKGLIGNEMTACYSTHSFLNSEIFTIVLPAQNRLFNALIRSLDQHHDQGSVGRGVRGRLGPQVEHGWESGGVAGLVENVPSGDGVH